MNILIVDDEINQTELLSGFLEKQGFNIFSTTSPVEAIDIVNREHVDLVISDYKMPELSGEELLEKVKSINPEINFIMITAYGEIDTAVNVMKRGAADFIQKPVDLSELIEKIRILEEQLLIRRTTKEIEDKIDVEIPFKNENILTIYKTIYKIAPKDINVLITGESGSGKEVIAKTIHKLSHRGKYPFVAVNCAAIPDNLFESEFFGHEKGAFTGAVSRKKGKFELANRGTIFLDEVGEIPLYLQGKLLRVLQEHVIERVGGEQSIKIDARIIAATNRDIKTMVKKGEFREDLFYRLNVISLHLPPLRERKKDIPIFINYFLKKFSGGKIGISNGAKDILIKYHYPGNIRELENIIQRAVALCSDNLIKPEDLPDEIKLDNLKEYDSGIDLSLNKEIERLEKNLILEALKKFEWNKSKAAKSLGINERVIRYKIEKYSLKKH